MGGKMRVGTKGNIRLSRGKKLFKKVFPKDRCKINNSNIELVGLNGEEAIFRFATKNNKLYVMFHQNDITTYNEDGDFIL